MVSASSTACVTDRSVKAAGVMAAIRVSGSYRLNRSRCGSLRNHPVSSWAASFPAPLVLYSPSAYRLELTPDARRKID